MARAGPHPWTVEEFLAFEAEEPERYAFVDGIVRMTTGAHFMRHGPGARPHCCGG